MQTAAISPNRRLRLAVGLCVVMTAGTLAAAPAATATIVVGQSIAGVQLGDSEAQVKAALRGQSREQPSVFRSELFYNGFLRIHFKSKRADRILSFSKKQKTTKSITIGSSSSQLKHAYPQSKCVEGQDPVYLYCVIAGRAHGRRSYTGFLFEVPTGGVVEVELGLGSVTEALSKP